MKIEDIIADRNYSEHPNKSLELASVRFKDVGANICKNIDPRKMFKFKGTQSKFEARIFPNTPAAEVTMIQLGELLQKALDMPDIQDVDVVRLGLLYILCKGILGKDGCDKVCVEWFLLVDDLQAWDSFPWGSYLFCHAYKCMQECFGKIKKLIQSGKKKELRCEVSGYTVPFRIWIWEMLPQLSLINAIDPRKMFKFKGTQSKFEARVFPNTPAAEVTVIQLGELLQKALDMPDIQDVDVVRLGLLYILCKGILGKDGCDKVCVEWFLLVDDLQAWDSFPWGSYLFCHAYKCMQECFGKIKKLIQSGKKKELRCEVSGYTVPFRGLEIPFPLRYLLKDEYLIISTDERFSPYQSPAASPENLGRREVDLENLEGRVHELEKKVNENNYNYDKPNNYDNNYTEFSPADRGHFDHFNEEPKEESNEEPKQGPIVSKNTSVVNRSEAGWEIPKSKWGKSDGAVVEEIPKSKGEGKPVDRAPTEEGPASDGFSKMKSNGAGAFRR
ncbi:hypothetical protein LXL04_038113 [Taraxacum kok-saghyz]